MATETPRVIQNTDSGAATIKDHIAYRALRYPVKVATARAWKQFAHHDRLIDRAGSTWTKVDPRLDSAAINHEGDHWRVEADREWRIPTATDNLSNLKPGSIAKVLKYGFGWGPMVRRYERGPVEIEPDDLVVDVGAYMGEFAVYAARQGAQVIAIEPNPIAYRCLEANAEGLPIDCRSVAIWDEPGRGAMTDTVDATDSTVDAKTGGTVELQTLAGLCSELGIDTIDFLKADIEGEEARVFDGASGIEIRKCGIDAGEGAQPDVIAAELAHRGLDVYRGDQYPHLVSAIR